MGQRSPPTCRTCGDTEGTEQKYERKVRECGVCEEGIMIKEVARQGKQ